MNRFTDTMLQDVMKALRGHEEMLRNRGISILPGEHGREVFVAPLDCDPDRLSPLTKIQRIREAQDLLGLHDGLMAYSCGVTKDVYRQWKRGTEKISPSIEEAILHGLDRKLGIPRAWIELGELPMLRSGTRIDHPILQALLETQYRECMDRMRAGRAPATTDTVRYLQSEVVRALLNASRETVRC